ncbi:hypothetical protein [Dyella sp.]|uniref:hypothetical protein n=1 Tax=Dyella sp. TaxID=1869338 RepID=UPI0028442720|nr:hypothetical protein [Dyella sp.]MDR3446008.1 hypothetical protein [Dyella sp.]
MSMLFDPATLPARDQYGFTWHPDLDERFQHDEFEEYLDTAKLRAFGLEYDTIEFEYDAPEALQQDFADTGEARAAAWTPTQPSGDSWRIAAIYGSEDGPVALFVREIAQGGVQ